MLVKGIIEDIAIDGYSAKVRVPKIHRVASDPLGIPTEELDDATIISIPGVIPVYKIGDVVFVQFEDDEISQPVICGLLERTETESSSAKLAGETSIDFAPRDWVIDELTKRDVRISEKMITSSLISYSTKITDRSGHFTVDIPNIDRLFDGLTIKVTIMKDPYLREGYNTLDVNGIGPKILFSNRTTVLADNASIRGAEYFLTYHSSGLGPYTVTSDSGAIPIHTEVVDGWIVTGGSGSFGDSPEYSALLTKVNGLEKEIEGNITTYVGEEIPTLYNYPISSWQGKDYLKHIGNLYINRATGNTYRFLAEISAESLIEYPYGKEERYEEESRGITWTFRNGEVHYAGYPDCEMPNVPYLEVINKGSAGGRLALPAGTYTLLVSTDANKSDIGGCLNLFSSATGDTHYSGGGSGLLSDGYRVLTTMDYDNVSWSTAINSGYQTCVTFTTNANSWATISFRADGTADVLEGNARIYLFPATTEFEWSLVTDTDLADLLERMGAAEGTILVQGQELNILQGQISSKIWQTEIDQSMKELKIGGPNLITDTNTNSLTQVDATNPKDLSDSTKTDITGEFITLTDPPVPGLKYGYKITTTTAGKTYGRNLTYRDSNLHMIPGETYTLSVYARLVTGTKADIRIRMGDMASQYPDDMTEFIEITNTDEWKQYSYTFVYQETDSPTYTYSRPAPAGVRSTYICSVEFCGMKLEFGNKPTPWCECNERQVTINNKYSELTQDVGSIRGEVSDLTTTVSTKADSSQLTIVDNRVAAVELTAQGLTSRVEATETRINAIVPDNYIPHPYEDTTSTINGITWTVQSGNSIKANGTATADSTFWLAQHEVSDPVPWPAGTYTLSGCPEGGSSSRYELRAEAWQRLSSGGLLLGTLMHCYGAPVTTNHSGDNYNVQIRCIIKSGTTVNNIVFKPMLEPGNEAHAFQDPSLTIRNMKKSVSEVNQTAEMLYTKVGQVQEQLTSVPYQNMIVLPYHSQSGLVDHGVTWTINGDNTVTATRTATNSYASLFYITQNSATPTTPFVPIDGTYAISGCPVGAVSGTRIEVNGYDGSMIDILAQDSGAGDDFTLDSTTKNYLQICIVLRVPSGLSVGSSVVFRPMLCTGDIPHEYVNPLYCGPSLQNQLQIQESEIQQTATQIASKVSQTDFTGNTIASLINQSATTVAITASKINLTGAVTIGSLGDDAKAALAKSVTQKNQYYLSTSNTSLSGGSWSDSAPTWTSGKYVWKRIVSTITYQDDTTSTVNGQAGYDKALTDALSAAATAQSTATSAQTAATSAQTAANANYKSVVPVYYRGTSSTAPSAPTSAVTSTAADTDSTWTLVQPKPKNGTYQFMSLQCQKASGTYEWSTVRALNEINVVASWCSVNDKTVIDGAHIYTGSITSAQIATGTITVGNMSSGAKDAFLSSANSVTEYYLSTSTASATGGSWDTSVPTWASGKYIWIRTATTTTNGSGTSSTTYKPSSSGVYDRALTAALSDAASAKSAASSAQTTANAGYKSVVPIYYRATSSTAPSKPSGAVTSTVSDSDDTWTLSPLKPKNGRYYFTCMQCWKGDGTYSWTAVRGVNELNAVASWCNSTNSTYIDGSYIYTGTITSGSIATGAITVSKLGDGSVTSAKIGSSAITETKIAAGAITTGKIAANAITADQIASNAITSAKIAAGAITAAKIAAGAITADKISVTSLESVAAKIGGYTINSTSLYTGSAITDNTSGNVGLSSSTFTRTVASKSRTGLKFAIGSKFGVNSSGDVYANTIWFDSSDSYINGNSLTFKSGTYTITYGNGYLSMPGAGGRINGRISSNVYDTDNLTYYVYSGNSTDGYGYMYAAHFSTVSDRRLKTEIEPLVDSEYLIYNLKPVSFKYRNEYDLKVHHGFIAQDAEEIVSPDFGLVVATASDDNSPQVEDEPYKTINYTELIADLVAVCQSQNKRIKALEDKLNGVSTN